MPSSQVKLERLHLETFDWGAKGASTFDVGDAFKYWKNALGSDNAYKEIAEHARIQLLRPLSSAVNACSATLQ